MKDKDYLDMPSATLTRRTFSFALDAIIVAIVGLLLTFLVAIPVLQNNSGFKASNNSLYDAVETMYAIEEEANLVELEEGSKTATVLSADFYNRYLEKQLVLSYRNDEAAYQEAGINYSEGSVAAAYENDELGYYFVHYKADHEILIEDYGSLTPRQYFVDEVFKANADSSLWIFSNDELPCLKAETGIAIYRYMNNESSDNTAYNSVFSFFRTVNEKAVNELLSYEPFQEAYGLYEENFRTMCLYENVALLITIALATFLAFTLPSIICPNGITLGKLITKTRTAYPKDRFLPKLGSSLLYSLMFLCIGFIVSLFSYGFYPLSATYGGWFCFLYLYIFSFIIAMFDFGLAILSRDHVGIVDRLTNSGLLDIRTDNPETAELPKP